VEAELRHASLEREEEEGEGGGDAKGRGGKRGSLTRYAGLGARWEKSSPTLFLQFLVNWLL
jgi:hypothetical protein